MLALANPVCLLALSRSDRPVFCFLLCAGLMALVLCLWYILGNMYVLKNTQKGKEETRKKKKGCSNEG